MNLSWVRSIGRLLSDSHFREALEEAVREREAAERRIRRMQADLDSCSESWFLTPRQTLDDCVPRDS